MLFTLYGEPVAKGRARSTHFGHNYTPQKTVDAELDIKNQIIRQMDEMNYEGFAAKVPLVLRCVFYRARPKSLAKKIVCPVQRPDTSNCIKLLEDAMNGLVYHDDSQIVEEHATKAFGWPPRIEVEIKRWLL